MRLKTGTFKVYLGIFVVWKGKISINHLKYSTKR